LRTSSVNECRRRGIFPRRFLFCVVVPERGVAGKVNPGFSDKIARIEARVTIG
jgi:hypothetical protein